MTGNNLELIIQNEPLLKEVTFNYDQLKATLNNKLAKYNELVVTQDAIKPAKEDRANLNKLEKSLANKGKEIKEKLLGGFDIKLKELRSMINRASDSIDLQVKAFEEAEADKKFELIRLIYQENIGELKEVLPFGAIFNRKWLNLGATMKAIESELKQIIDIVRKDLTVIDTLETEFKLQVKDYYLRTRDLSGALVEKARLEKAKKDIAELEKPKADGGIVIDKDAGALKSEASEVDNLDWANTSKKPKETSIKITCNDAQLSLLKVFLEMHKIKFEEVI